MEYHIFPKTDLVKQLPYYIAEIHKIEHSEAGLLEHNNDYDAFFYAFSGSGELIVHGEHYELCENYGFFLPAHTPFRLQSKKEPWELRCLVVAGNGLKYLYSLIDLKKGLHHLWNLTGLEIQMNKIHQELTSNKTYGILLASTHADEFITEYAKQAGLLQEKRLSLQNNDKYSTHMRMIQDYIDYHYMDSITLNNLCELTELTPQHICRIFRQKTGMSPVEYINRKRIETSKQLLKTTDDDIIQISLMCGFESSNYFWKTFKKFEGITPGEYRKRYKK